MAGRFRDIPALKSGNADLERLYRGATIAGLHTRGQWARGAIADVTRPEESGEELVQKSRTNWSLRTRGTRTSAD